MKERLERVKDAIDATKAAVEEGILPGGGVSLLKVAQSLDKLKADSDEEKVGINILKTALEQPIRKLALNCGEDPGYVLSKVKDALTDDPKSDIGYHALTGEFVSMTKAGILDPAKVTKSALTNAVSVGTMILTTDVLIADIPEKKTATPDMNAMGGMDGMM